MSDFGAFSEFSVGSVIGRAWTVMLRKPLAFLGITLLSSILSTLVAVVLAGILGAFFSLFNMSSDAFIITGVIGGVAGLISMVIVPAIFQGALTYAVFMLLLHGWTSVKDAFLRSASRVLTVILASLTMGLALGLSSLVPALAGAFLGFAFFGAFGMLMAIIGMIAAIVISIILIVKWSVFASACVVEKTGAMASLGRSSALTKGYRGKIFGVYILVGIMVVIFSAVAEFFNGLIFGDGLLGNIFSAILSTPPLTFFNVLPAVIYFSLRVAKENLTPESLADIFD